MCEFSEVMRLCSRREAKRACTKWIFVCPEYNLMWDGYIYFGLSIYCVSFLLLCCCCIVLYGVYTGIQIFVLAFITIYYYILSCMLSLLSVDMHPHVNGYYVYFLIFAVYCYVLFLFYLCRYDTMTIPFGGIIKVLSYLILLML